MKSSTLRNIFRFIVCTIIGAYVLILTIFNFGPSQQIITQFVASSLSEKLHTDVSIGNIQIGLFNRLILNDVLIKDYQDKDLLKARIVSAKIELRSLIKEQLSLRTISLIDTDISLYKQRVDSAANYQFLVDAFSSKEKKKENNLNLRINSIILRRVSVHYNESYKPLTPSKFNPSHLKIDDLNANISLKNITPDSLNLRVRSFAFKEHSGLCLKKLHFKLTANRTGAHIEDFTLEMPQTRITQGDLLATYDVRKDFTNLFSTLRLGSTINKLQVGTNDIRPFVKLPKGFNQVFQLSTVLLLTPEKLQLNQFSIHNQDHSLQLKTDATLNRAQKQLTSIQITLKQLKVENQFTQQIAKVLKLKDNVSPILKRVGDIEANGSMTYYTRTKGGAASVILHTSVGNIATHARINNHLIRANIQLTHIQPDLLLNNSKLPKQIALNAQIQADLSKKDCLRIESNGNIQSFVYNQHTFRGIKYNLNYQPNHIEASVNSSDPSALLSSQTQIKLQNNRINNIILTADVKQLHPTRLGINLGLGQASFSGSIKANLQNLMSKLPSGTINVHSFDIKNGPKGDYHLKDLSVALVNTSKKQQLLHINSDFLDADIEGSLVPQDIYEGVLNILHRSLPGLAQTPRHLATSHDEWNVNAHLKQTDVLHKFLGLNIQIKRPLHFIGTLNAGNGRTSLSAFTDQISVSGQIFIQPSIYINGADNQYKCLVQTHKMMSGREYSIVADLSTQNGQLITQIEWNGVNEKNYNGSFESQTCFHPTQKGVNFDMHIRPTQFALADTLWNIASGQLSYIDRRLSFSGVELSHANQSLRVDGELAPNQKDSIVAQLHNIDVDYILNLVNFDAVSFGGKASGKAIFTQRGLTPQLHAHLNIPNFTFNHGLMGDASINANWNRHDNRINLDAEMRLPKTHGYGTNVQGYVSLSDKELELNIEANHTQLDFLHCYIDGIFGDFNGDATGNVCLYGPFKKLDFKGQVKANCSAKVLATGVHYNVVDGEVVFAPGEFAFHNFTLTDSHNGIGKADGVLRHTHLKKLNYAFNVTATNLLCYNQPRQPDFPFYSTTTGSGNIKLKGWPNHFVADITLTPTSPTLFVYNLGTQSSLSKDDRMMRFHALTNKPLTPYDTLSTHQKEEKYVAEKSKEDTETDLLLNFSLNLTPQAQIRIITDERSGDAITAYGQGPLRATWHNKGGFNMYGVYTLNRGEYNLSLQDIIRKNLVLQSGSSITFTGDPLNADLALKALYTVNGVSLNDLNFGAGFSTKTVRADCILNIGGKTRAPQINFDLDLHNISEDEKQMVRQLISTDEDMNRQVMCLLSVGRFLTMGQNVSTSGTTTSQQQSSAAVRSFLSTTLTGQLNAAISSLLGSQSKWSFGTNFMPGSDGWNNVEVDGLLQGRLLNDRLLINGNFGYRDNPYYASNFIGDFDIRYLLTPRGSVSLRAYSETNDRYFTKSSLTTQGIGIMLQRDFVRLRDLFRKNNKVFKSPKKK